MAIDMNALRAKAKQKEKKPEFIPIELNEGNVQAIFNRCLATAESKRRSPVVLFPRVFGYQPEDEILVQFDSSILEANKRGIEYLFGQLHDVHLNGSRCDKSRRGVTFEDFVMSYVGKKWTNDKDTLLNFLYLGCNSETTIIKPFNKKINGTDIRNNLKPTLSPKDPNFPAWWEEHKAEWEA